MLKEQIIPKIHDKDICPNCRFFGDCSWLKETGNWCLRKQGLVASKILNLFKAEVDKLTVVGDEELDKKYIIPDKAMTWVYHLRSVTKEAQLQADKDKLLDLMGE